MLIVKNRFGSKSDFQGSLPAPGNGFTRTLFGEIKIRQPNGFASTIAQVSQSLWTFFAIGRESRRRRMIPRLDCLFLKTSSPKSLSDVRMSRASKLANSSQYLSGLPGDSSPADSTSCLFARSHSAMHKGMFSSTRQRIRAATGG